MLNRISPATGQHLADEDSLVLGAVTTAGSTAAYVVSNPDCLPYVANMLTVRDRDTLATKWTASLPANIGGSSLTPTIAGGRIFVASDSALFTFDLDGCGASSCSHDWVAPFGGSLGTPIGGANGRVYVAERSDPTSTLHALDAATGAEIWSFDFATIAGVAVTDDTVFVTGTGPVGAPDPQGVLFAFAAGCNAPSRCAPWLTSLGDVVPSDVVVGGQVVYVAAGPEAGGTTGSVRAYAEAGCGAPTCESPLVTVPIEGTPGSLAVAGGRVFVTSDTGDLPNPATLTALSVP